MTLTRNLKVITFVITSGGLIYRPGPVSVANDVMACLQKDK